MKLNGCYIKKKIIFLLAAFCIGSTLHADNELKLLADSLRRMIDEKPAFVQKKEQRIHRIKCMLKDSGLTAAREYGINLQLYNEYKKFNIDSAIHYAGRNLEVARQLNKPHMKNEAALQLSLVYAMCGRYRDAELILEKIKPSELTEELLTFYYQTYSRFWEYYSISAANNHYRRQRAAYQDSLISLLDHTSFDYKLSRAYYYGGCDSVKAKKILKELLETEETGSPNYAMITHAYASFCWHQKRMDDRRSI